MNWELYCTIERLWSPFNVTHFESSCWWAAPFNFLICPVMTLVNRPALRVVIAGDTAKDLVKPNSPVSSTHCGSAPRWLRNTRIRTVPRYCETHKLILCCHSLKFRVLTFWASGASKWYEYLQQKWNTDNEKAIMHNNQDADAIITTKSLINIFLGPCTCLWTLLFDFYCCVLDQTFI